MNVVAGPEQLELPIPLDRPVALLLRHAERPDFPPHTPGDDVPLTPAGQRAARTLGVALGARLIGLSTSPVRRCVETADAIRAGAGFADAPRLDRMLGDPGAFVEDPELAWSTWQRWGHQAVVAALMGGNRIPPGFADPASAARDLARHVASSLRDRPPGIFALVTHDIVLAALVARTLGSPLDHGSWPRFLQGTWLWVEPGCIRLVFDGQDAKVQRQDELDTMG